MRTIQLPLAHSLATCLLVIALCMAAPSQAQHRPPEGFEPIFTGRDLEGWDGGEVMSPTDIEKMSYSDWSTYRNRMSDGVHQHWRIEGGALIGKGGGPDLVSWKHYADFEMWVDWKVTSDSSAAVAFRYGSPIRLLDPDGQHADKGHKNAPVLRADKAVGQWNRMFIRMVGPSITVVLNEKKVVDNAVLENLFDQKRPIDRTGPIHLQAHAGEVQYRNIYIRELSDEQSNEHLTEIGADDQSFTPLFNGKDLTGWAGAINGYEVVDGTLRCKRRGSGNIQTEKQYANFVVRMEFKLSPGGNNGLLIRTPNTNPTHTRDTLEIQILDDHHLMHRQLAPYQYHGSAYGFTPAIRGYLRPIGQWNYQETYVKDDHIKVILNGYLILDTRLKQIAPDHPAANTKQGHLGLCGYSDPVEFRNIRIKRIK